MKGIKIVDSSMNFRIKKCVIFCRLFAVSVRCTMPMPSHPAVDVGSSVELLLLPREENILFCKKKLY